jgi:hypothetical protein
MVHLVILQIPRNVKTIAQVKQPLEGQPMCGLVGRKVHGNLGAVVSAAGIVPCHQGVGECELSISGLETSNGGRAWDNITSYPCREIQKETQEDRVCLNICITISKRTMLPSCPVSVRH